MHIQLRTRGRITLPVEIRQKLGIKDGTHIHFVVDERARKIILTPVTREYVHSVRGKFKGSGAMQSRLARKGN
jgi:AbrB family looped-hinge helix DNA binding protein